MIYQVLHSYNVEETQSFPPVCLLYFHTTTTLAQNTSLVMILVTKCVEVFLHTKQFSATPADYPTI